MAYRMIGDAWVSELHGGVDHIEPSKSPVSGNWKPQWTIEEDGSLKTRFMDASGFSEHRYRKGCWPERIRVGDDTWELRAEEYRPLLRCCGTKVEAIWRYEYGDTLRCDRCKKTVDGKDWADALRKWKSSMVVRGGVSKKLEEAIDQSLAKAKRETPRIVPTTPKECCGRGLSYGASTGHYTISCVYCGVVAQGKSETDALRVWNERAVYAKLRSQAESGAPPPKVPQADLNKIADDLVELIEANKQKDPYASHRYALHYLGVERLCDKPEQPPFKPEVVLCVQNEEEIDV